MNNPQSNQIISAIPKKEYQRFSEHLEPVDLSLNEILSQSHQKIKSLYFPTEGVVSLISVMDNGSTTEIGLVGKEGMVGMLEFIGEGISISNNRYQVQVEGTAMRIDSQVLRVEFDRSETLQKLLLRYALNLFNQVSQCAACNNHHTVKQRTARLLLMLKDRSNDETLFMTQQLLSRMLGVRRTGVTEVAKQLQRQGIIDYHRGKINIIDRPALEEIACECYQVLRLGFRL